MMYVSMDAMLDKANKEQYGVMAINCFNLESAYSVISAAEDMKSPIIIDLLMEHIKKHLGMEVVLPPIIDMARKSSVQVAINLDHGKSEEYVNKAIENGFSSVMIDASEHGFEENILITRKIVHIAKRRGVSVEAEVGTIGAVLGDNYTKMDMYTNPDRAIEFIKRTGITALAVSFGSSHGVMPEDYVPKFNFDIVKKIKKATNIPLVLHGGSGCGAENIMNSIKCGINKVNVGSDVMRAQSEAIYGQLLEDRCKDFVDVVHGTISPAVDMVKHYIKIVGSEGKSI